MNTLVKGDDTMPAGRVLPKVFADVPSTAELIEAKTAAAQAKGATGRLAIVTVLLAGALVASVAFVAFSMTGDPTGVKSKLTTTQGDLTKALADLDAAKKDAAAKKADAEDLHSKFGIFTPLADLNANIQATQKVISDAIKDKVGSNVALIRDPPNGVGLRDEWAAYENTAPWPVKLANNNDWQAFVRDGLQDRLAKLTSLQPKVTGWKAPSPTELPKCQDNRPDLKPCRS